MKQLIADIHMPGNQPPFEAAGVVDPRLNEWGRATRWLPMEVNGNEPQLVYEKDHQPTARLHAKLLAQQLRRVAEAGSAV